MDDKKNVKVERLEMLKMYLDGASFAKIAETYGMTRQAVHQHSKRQRWKEKKAKYYQTVFDDGISKLKRITAMSIGLIDKFLLDKVKESATRALTLDEVGEIRQILAKVYDQVRLEDGKPTVNTGGVVVHELRLPPGVSSFGVLPPSNGVKLIETDVTTSKAKKNDDNIDDLL